MGHILPITKKPPCTYKFHTNSSFNATEMLKEVNTFTATLTISIFKRAWKKDNFSVYPSRSGMS